MYIDISFLSLEEQNALLIKNISALSTVIRDQDDTIQRLERAAETARAEIVDYQQKLSVANKFSNNNELITAAMTMVTNMLHNQIERFGLAGLQEPFYSYVIEGLPMKKIEAIKKVRILTSCGLREAKDYVEEWMSSQENRSY